MADYRRRFERVSRFSGSDLSVSAVELEMLASRAFGDLSLSTHLQLVCDRFIAGQRECSLHRHLDSMEPGTSIQDIVDSCRVWESHAEFTDCRRDQPIPKRPLPVYMIDEVGTEDGQLELAPDVSSEDQDMLGSLMRHLLPMPSMSPPRARIHSERDQLNQRLLGKEHPVQPLLEDRSSFTDMEILLQSLFPVRSPATEQPRPTVHHNRLTVVCCSCGESGHAASRWPTLDEAFSFLPAGWRADRAGDGFVMRSPRKVVKRETTSDPGRGVGSITRISNDCGPQFPVVGDGITYPAARDEIVSRVKAGWCICGMMSDSCTLILRHRRTDYCRWGL